ncbi:hypothetical protein TA3x_004763 [Tundrisphaera sp. TA3]|uniref:hypothetical protein n=1 Tax=Tundrisphaera sp. TA3 TaxID=3435775 RepID=UPI003EBDE568
MARRPQPSLADLWRATLARLERQGVGDAAGLARQQAIAALIAINADPPGSRDPEGCNLPPRPSRGRCRPLACASS